LRDRLNRLATVEDGITKIVKENSVQRPTLVHGDFGQQYLEHLTDFYRKFDE